MSGFSGVLDYFGSASGKLFRSILIFQPSSITNSLLAIDYTLYPRFLIQCSPPPGEGKIMISIVRIRKWSLEILTSLTQTHSAGKWQIWDLDPAVWRLSALSKPVVPSFVGFTDY